MKKQHIVIEITHGDDGKINYNLTSDIETTELQAHVINLSKMILEDYGFGSEEPQNSN